MSNNLPIYDYPIADTEFISSKISKRLRELRKKEKLTQVQVASILGVTPKTYRSWEKGELPKTVDLFNLANIFDCSVDYLLGRISEKNRIEAYIEKNLPLSINTIKKMEKLKFYLDFSKSENNKEEAYYICQILEYLIGTVDGGILLSKIIQYLNSSDTKRKYEYNSLLHGIVKHTEHSTESDYLEDICNSLKEMKQTMPKYKQPKFVNCKSVKNNS